MSAPDWTELEGYGHRIRYRWLDTNSVEVEKDVAYLTPREEDWREIRAHNFLDGFRLGYVAAEASWKTIL